MSKKKQRKIAARQARSATVIKENVSSTSPGMMTNWLVGLVAILPLIITSEPLDPVLIPRYLFLGIFLFVFIAVFFLLNKNYIPFRSLPQPVKIVLGLGAAYWLWSLVSMASSINFREGYLDTFRHGLNLVLLYVILVTVFKEGEQWMKIAKTIVIISLIQSLAGILQFYDIAFTEVPGANEKPFGLMGNRNFFGSAQVYLIPFVLYVLMKAGKQWKYIAGISMAGLVISILLSQTRSAWLATAVLFVVATILMVIFLSAERKKWLIGSAVALLASAAIVSGVIFTDSSGKLKTSVKERAISLTGSFSDNSTATVNVNERLKLWLKTGSIIKDNPLLGVGPGNWKIVIPAYGTANTAFANGIYSPDRPHNVYLQVASETGIPGALFYFGMWVMIAFCGFRVLIQKEPVNNKLPVILMMAGLSAVAVDAFFSFPIDRIEHNLYIMLMGGFILGAYTRQWLKEKLLPEKTARPVLVFVFMLIAFNIFLGAKNYNFEVRWKHTNVYNTEGRYLETIEEAAKGKNSFAVMDVSGAPLELFTAHAYKQTRDYQSALQEIKKASAYHPNNARIYSEWGTIYTDLQKYDSAIIYYHKALQLTPTYEVPIKNLAANYFTMGNDSACVAELQKINIENDPYLQDMMRQALEAIAQKQ